MDQSELESLKADLKRMQARVDELETNAEAPVNRRNMLRGLGAAAAGAAVGGLAFARPAAALDTNTLIIGSDTQTSQSPTLLIASGYTATGSFGAFHVTDDTSNTGSFSSGAAIAAVANEVEFDTAFAGTSTYYGALFDAPTPLKLIDSLASGPPVTTDGWTGEFKVDNGDVWVCVDSDFTFIPFSHTAKWRKITGPQVAGAFHAVTPFRAYDSRAAAPSPGILNSGSNRTVSIKDSRDNSGTVIQANTVPAGATAVAANITVTGTTGGGGYLAVNPGGTTSETSSAINWFGAGQNLANGLMLTLDGSRQLTVVCGSGTGGNTHFIIDISGYFL